MRTTAPVDFTRVSLTGTFWRERLDTVLNATVPSQFAQLEANGILSSLDLPQPVPELHIPRNPNGFTTQIFWDSDVGKWIEAASYALAHKRDAAIEAKIEAITDQLEKAQAPDGYLNCWYLEREPDNRWTNLRDNHELYNAGHLLEGAIAYFQVTGERRLLGILEQYLDHIAAKFGPVEGQQRGYPGHQEIELALIKLYHLTGDARRLDLAAYFINERGTQPHYFDVEREMREETPEAFVQQTYEYNQSHLPVREQTKVVGHAVRAMYMYAAMADLAADLGDDALKAACETLWTDVTRTRMYVTGGFGPSQSNEGFTHDYDLPNDTAYAETCASVAMVFWAQRMLNLDLDASYADILENALYNNVLAGLSRDGTHYFYDNKLESDGSHRRWDWHPCPCCTMNVARLVASVGGYFYSSGAGQLVVHLYGGTEARLEVDGIQVVLIETSNYPWSGEIALKIDPEHAHSFALKLRIPGWCQKARAQINGAEIEIDAMTEKGYLVLNRKWLAGDEVSLAFDMPAERLYAHPSITADIGRVALRRGPLIYCIEQADNPAMAEGPLALPRTSKLSAVQRKDLFDGIIAITADGQTGLRQNWGDELYRTQPLAGATTSLAAIPYYLWCNRGSNPMQVWIAETG